MKRFLIILVSLVLLTGVASSVQAITMQELFDGEEIIVGDKLFFDWNLIDVVSTDPQYDPDFTQFRIDEAIDPLLVAIEFESDTGGFFVEGDNFLDINFGYSVEVLDPNLRIKDIAFILEDGLLLGDGFIGAVEDVYADNGDLLASLFIDTGLDIFEDAAEFAPQDIIHVEKNILLGGLFPEDIAALWQFEQQFSQEAVTVPEPATLILLGTGLTGIAFARRKFSK